MLPGRAPDRHRPGRRIVALVVGLASLATPAVAPAWGATPAPTVAPARAAAPARPAAPKPAPKPTPPTTAPLPAAKAWVLVDDDTGRVLASQNEHQRLPPASLTKMVTGLVAVGWLQPDLGIEVSPRVATVYPDRVGMKVGEIWTLDITLHALLIASANDAAYALAEKLGGSVERFMPYMDEASAEMGMTDHPVWHDPAGLDGTEGVGGGNLVSARDLAIAGRDLLHQPQLAHIVGLQTYDFTGPDGVAYSLSSHNRAFLASYPGAIGIKTGFTDPAGVCIVAAATRGGRTMTAVVMNGTNPDQTATTLLNRGFATPVAAEPAGDVLPRVRLPGPAPVAAPVATPAPTVAPPQRAAPAVARPARPAGSDTALTAGLGGAGALVAVAAVLVGRRSWRRRRRTGRGAHSGA